MVQEKYSAICVLDNLPSSPVFLEDVADSTFPKSRLHLLSVQNAVRITCFVLGCFLFMNSGLTYTILWLVWGAEPLAHVLAAGMDCGSVMTLLWSSATA